jgi:hypothetical protein
MSETAEEAGAIALRERQELAAPRPDTGGTLLNFVAQAVADPNIDVTKLEALLRMQREIVADEARLAFNEAMSAAQAEIEPVARTSQNLQTNSMYAKLEAVDGAIRPIYTRHGFSLSFDEEELAAAHQPVNGPPNMKIMCRVTRGRHSEVFSLLAPADTLGPKGAPVKTALHGRGSTITFLRRYLTCNIFNVVLRNQDDDGVRGGQRFITEAQAAELRDLTKTAKRQEGALLQRLFAGTIHTFEEIEPGAFLVVRNTLDGIIHQEAAKAAKKEG